MRLLDLPAGDIAYFSLRLVLSILAAAAAAASLRYALEVRRDRQEWRLAAGGCVLLIAVGILSAYDAIDNVLLRPHDPLTLSSWLWFLLFDLPSPIWALLAGKIHASLAELAASGSSAESARNASDGICTRRQAVPSQCSTSALQTGPLVWIGSPSAQASPGLVATTEDKLSCVPQCRSTATIRQPGGLTAPAAATAPAAEAAAQPVSSRMAAQIATERVNRGGTGKA